jgi:hypothetical protein
MAGTMASPDMHPSHDHRVATANMLDGAMLEF